MYIQRYMHITGWVFDVNVYTWVYTKINILYIHLYVKFLYNLLIDMSLMSFLQ